MIVEIPSRFTRDTMYNLLDKIINPDIQPRDKAIAFDFNSLTHFIEPVGVTILSNLIEWLLSKKVVVGILPLETKPSFSSDPIKYLDDSMFFQKYLGNNVSNKASIRSTTLPLQFVSYANSYQWLDKDFVFWLSRQLNITQESLLDIKMCFGEIFNNINDHSFADHKTGCIFAQHYPKSNTVNIAISDFGVGIPNNIRKIHPSLTDSEALLKAVEEGVTSRTSPRNLGVGLYTLYKNVVEDNGGSIFIHSNYGILECINGQNGPKMNSYIKNSHYPGTLIEVVLRTDAIINIEDDKEEFEW